jgi:uncharacterized protein (UPF0335 family)
MSQIPRLKKQSDRRNVTFSIEADIKDLYELAKRNGHDSPEIARRAIVEVFRKLEPELKRPAS